jgi:hypothetical protein
MREGGRLIISIACIRFLFIIMGIASTSTIIEIR